MNDKIQILELFGGIGSPRIALKNLGVPVKSIDYVEIDEKAVRSYNAMFHKDLAYDTQTVVGWNLKPDILVHGSPCQDFSIAGHQKGADEGSETRSSLMWETVHIIEQMGEWKPKVVVWEKSGCNNRWGLTTIEDIARDYEKTHPDKIVLAATNNWLAWTKDNNRGEIKSCQIAGGLNFRVRDLQGTKDSTEGSFGSGYSPSNNMLGFDYDGNAYFCDNWNSGGNYTDKLYVSFYENEITKEKLDIIVDKINDLPQENELAIIFPNYDGITDLTGYDAYRMDAIKMRYDNVIGTKEFIERDAFALGNFAEKVTTIDFTTNPNSYYLVIVAKDRMRYKLKYDFDIDRNKDFDRVEKILSQYSENAKYIKKHYQELVSFPNILQPLPQLKENYIL